MITSRSSSLLTLLIISLFVYTDIICENVLVIINDQQPHFIATAYLFGFLILQIFCASIQSGLSDFFGRKKSLILSFGVSLFSLLCAYLSTHFSFFFGVFLIFALVGKALWGNTIPISFAAIGDTQGKNYRKSFAIASSTYSLSFITLILINLFSSGNLFYITVSAIILLVSLITCFYTFIDSADRTAHTPHDADFVHYSHSFFSKCWKMGTREISLLKEELRRPLTKYGLSAYVLWEISMYSIIISQVDLNPGSSQDITLAMMISYLIGVVILQIRPCNTVSDRKMINIGYLFSFFSLTPYFFLMHTTHSQNLLLGICYGLHAIGNAFLSPTILSVLAKKRSAHEQGKILGLVESADTIAFLVATIFVMIHSYYQWPVIALILFSLVSFSVSWIYFPIIKKLEKLIYKTDGNA